MPVREFGTEQICLCGETFNLFGGYTHSKCRSGNEFRGFAENLKAKIRIVMWLDFGCHTFGISMETDGSRLLDWGFLRFSSYPNKR